MNVKLFSKGVVTKEITLSNNVVVKIVEDAQGITLRLRNKAFNGTRIFKNISPHIDKFIYDGELYNDLRFVRKTSNQQEIDINDNGIPVLVEDLTLEFKIGG